MIDSNKKTEFINTILNHFVTNDLYSIKPSLFNIINIIKNPLSTTKDLQESIKLDPPLSAKVLKTANAAFHSSKSPITEIEKALVWLGFTSAKEISLKQKYCRTEISDGSEVIMSRKDLWKQSIAVALFNKMLHRKEFGGSGESGYITGLLHQIGIIILTQIMPKKYSELLKTFNLSKTNLIELENKKLGLNHQEIGRAIMAHWELGEEIATAIGCHHQPYLAPITYSKQATLLYLSDYMCQLERFGFRDYPYPDERLFEKSLERLKINFRLLESIASEVKQKISKLIDEGVI